MDSGLRSEYTEELVHHDFLRSSQTHSCQLAGMNTALQRLYDRGHSQCIATFSTQDLTMAAITDFLSPSNPLTTSNGQPDTAQSSNNHPRQPSNTTLPSC